ncbi:cbb3-type cytochrome c oxidase N-terminal domain-containing protein [Paraflavitalea sp. CAU 1676]|uniref:cbb3-type cytochrome c oxidase N-terminal domain-containing protein n=1 Tax=Paraflavitalea sp. CAU 1676 TaxID=3032598 RepID=UPI0023DBE970|nr:cbb3-type cytochrome c oxidase N-terminal domain-containing protein [Paraflavitalea sp. CAU 1676]MDF2192388.1 cbb3-type cytochrome c oxidase N-terminal domain-containing protein [Paraflavitalea sp. CAU 1676]
MNALSNLLRRSRINRNMRKVTMLAGCLFSSSLLWAQRPAPDAMGDPFVVTLVVIMALLALIIGLLAYVVLGSAELYRDKEKQEAALLPLEPEKKSQGVAPVVTAVVVLLLVGLPGLAQVNSIDPDAVVGYKLSDTAFYLMTGVIFVELLVIAALLYNLRVLLDIKKKKVFATNGATAKPKEHWWDKINKFKPVEQEAAMDMGHEYDGIRELDNRLPPWWLYGFYACIIFSVVYLWRFHVSHSGPSSEEEYQLAVKEAEEKKAAYLVKAANNVDEHSVKLMTDASDLANGQKIFETACFACHGKLGEGGVGPNLTDKFWLHGGSVQDIFKTIKYGVPEKGMKSWKDDYSPAQIAQLASYIHSLKGSNPPNGKAAQGESEAGEAGDDAGAQEAAKVAVDSSGK